MTEREQAVLRDLADRTDVLAQQVAAAEAAVAGREYTGSDATGLVEVTVDARGRVTAVQVAAHWRNGVGVDGLASAVGEAIRAANAVMFGAVGTALRAESRRPAPPPRPPLPPTGTIAGQLDAASARSLTSEGGAAAMNALADLMRTVNEGIAGLTAQLDTHVGTGYEGRSRAGHVTATVTGANVLRELRYDLRWLVNARDHNIGRETTEALAAAHHGAGEHTVAGMVAEGPLAEVTALAQNPHELARRLGLG
jgi:DNA-binding protein YbaB